MPGTLTPLERLSRLDRGVEDLKQAFVDAAAQLTEAPEVDDSLDERWAAINQRLRELRGELQPADYDKEQIVGLYRTLLDIHDLLDEPQSLDTIDALLIRLEQVRHVVRDALDEHVEGAAENVGLVVEELDHWLPHVRREALAELLGVDRRTIARWAKQSAPPSRRVATVARLVAILRHNWTGDGIVAWFHRPRRELAGRLPLTLLGEENYDEQALIAAARGGRSQYAS